jgi:hypothetical protein
MPIKINSTGGGSITIDAPNTASAFTVTLPAQTATLITFPSGTAMMFVQTTAPTGWTKSTTHNNKALRVVSGSASSGGSVAFTTAFASQSVAGTVGNTTISTSEMPSHSHVPIWTDGNGFTINLGGGVRRFPFTSDGSNTFMITTSVGGGGSHTHSFTGTAINLAVQYVDVIIATVD